MIAKSLHPVFIVGAALLISAGMLMVHFHRPLSNDSEVAEQRSSEGGRPSSRGLQDPAALLRSLARETDPLAQSREVVELTDRLPSTEFPVLVDRCRKAKPAQRAETIQLLFAAWAKVDPPAAASFAANDASSLKAVISEWSSFAPQDALDWITGHVVAEGQGPLLASALPALPPFSPAQLSATLAGLSDKTREEVITGFVASLSQEGDEAMTRWLQSIDNPRWRFDALRAIIQNAAPAEAIDWMSRYAGELEQQEGALSVVTLFKGWAARDADAAHDAFEKLPPGTTLHRRALEWLVTNRDAEADPRAAAAMLDQFPDEVDDQTLTSLIRIAREKDLELAADLTLKFQEPRNDPTLILTIWARQDLVAAKAWLGQHPVSQTQRLWLPEELKETP